MRIYDDTDYKEENINIRLSVGNKAAALLKNREIVTIPKFCVLETSLLSNLLDLPENLNVKDQLTEIWACKTNLLVSAPKISSLFRSIKVPFKWKEELVKHILDHGMKAPFAVRSSSIIEDSNVKSAAGMFSSYLDVEIDDLWDSILDCLCSTFMPNALNAMGEDFGKDIFHTMAVIIQEMAGCEMNGVMFTVHPIHPDLGMLIEYVRGSGSVTEGNSKVNSITVKTKLTEGFNEDWQWINQLVDAGKKLQDHGQGMEYDIEWGMKNQNIYILQVRPITVISKSICANELMDLSNIGEKTEQELLSLSGKYKSWRYKKAPLYALCQKLGIRTLRWLLVFASNEQDLLELSKQAVEKIHSDYVLLMYNGIIIDCVVPSCDVPSYLRKLYQQRGDKNMVCSIREIRDNTASAISCYDPKEDAVLIEALPGAMKGLKSGLNIPARYWMTQTGIKESSIPEIQDYYYFSTATNSMEKKKYEQQEILSQIQVAQIYKATKQMYLNDMKGALEWWVCDGEPIVTDISMNQADEKQLLNGNVVSPGTIHGIVVEINEVDDMEELSYSNAVSVNNYENSVTGISKIANQIERIHKIRQEGKQAIVKIEKPFLAMVPVMEEADGVIFKEASVLCHTSIILREKHIPAIAVGDKYNDYMNGEEVRI